MSILLIFCRKYTVFFCRLSSKNESICKKSIGIYEQQFQDFLAGNIRKKENFNLYYVLFQEARFEPADIIAHQCLDKKRAKLGINFYFNQFKLSFFQVGLNTEMVSMGFP